MALTVQLPRGYHLAGGSAGAGTWGGYYLARDPPTPEEIAQLEADRLRRTQGLAGAIAGLEAEAVQQGGVAAQSGYQAAGAGAEGEAYRIAAGYAGSSADMAVQAAGLRGFQEQQNIMRTAAGQRAGFAAAGFGEAGTSIDLLRSTIREGAISTALIELQGNIDATGYLAEAATLTGQSEAANAARDAALALQSQQLAASQQASIDALTLRGELDKLENPPGFRGRYTDRQAVPRRG